MVTVLSHTHIHMHIMLLPVGLPCVQVWPADRRMHMRCSAGCSMVWHQECWRKFQELYDKETSINLTHVRAAQLAVRAHRHTQLWHDGCCKAFA